MEVGLCGSEIPIARIPECRDFHKRKLEIRQKDAKRLGVPLMISEYGGVKDSLSGALELKNIVEVCDEMGAISHIHWTLKDFNDFTTSNPIQQALSIDGSISHTSKTGTFKRAYI